MNMHGFITPAGAEQAIVRPNPLQRLLAWARGHRAFLLVVILPTALVAGYYYGIAANQYQSEAHFVVRSASSGGASSTGLSGMLGIAGGAATAQSDAMSVSDYLLSHEAIAQLGRTIGIVDRFRRPEADILSRLRASPLPETLLSYYRKKVLIKYDRDTGISELTVRSFRPGDSYTIIRALLALGERQVNELNQRSYNDGVSAARVQLAEAEKGVATIQRQMTGFRQASRDIDPAGTGGAQITLISTLTAELASSRAQLSAMSQMVAPTSPQYIAMRDRVRALEREVASQSSKLTGAGSTIASNLGSYEDLKIRQDFAAKRYEAAAANLEKAREQVSRQQLYLVRIVEPNLAVKSQYPERGRIVLTVLVGLLLAYGIGWLLVAGVREHAI